MADPAPPSSRALRWGLVALILTLAGWARLSNLQGTFQGGRVWFTDMDSAYHVRRVRLALADLPQVPSFDRWANHPEGAQLDWPKGFDLTLAGLCRLVTAAGGGDHAVDVTLALVDPLLGLLACLLVIGLGRRLAGEAAGLLAGLLAAVLPLLSGYSTVGRVDHHAAEPILLLAPLLLLADALAETRRRRRAALVLSAGAALSAAIAFWPGALAAAGLLFPALACAGLLEPSPAARGATLGLGGHAFLGAALVALPISLLHPWALQGSFAYYAPSLLQPVLFLVGGLALLLASRLAGRTAALAVLLLVPLLAVGSLLALLPELRSSLAAAAGYLGRGEIQIAQVEESRPLLAGGLAAAARQYTFLLPLGPALLVHALLRFRRLEGPARTRSLLCGLCLLGATPLALLQLRLGSLLAPLWCALWGVALVDLHAWLASRWRQPAAALAVALPTVALLVPTLALHHPRRFTATADLLATLDGIEWLRDRAARPGRADRPLERPRFSVLGRWQWGHYLTTIAGQANVANGLGQTPANLRGVRDAARIFLSRTPAEAEPLLAAREVRYLFVTPLLEEVAAVARHTALAPEALVSTRADGVKVVHPEFLRLFNTRLLHYDGRRFRLQGRSYPPLRRLRLVYECEVTQPELDREVAACKIFERVRGALLEGEAPPGSTVGLELPLQTNRGRRFVYRDEVPTDASGRFALRVPYPTEQGFARGSYLLRAGARTLGVSVPLEAVEDGRALRLPPLRDPVR